MIRSDKYLWEVCMKIYKEMYEKADPPADIYELIRKGITKKDNWFLNYYLEEDKQVEIINRICKEHRCSKYEKEKISNTIWLGSAPSSCRKK